MTKPWSTTFNLFPTPPTHTSPNTLQSIKHRAVVFQLIPLINPLPPHSYRLEQDSPILRNACRTLPQASLPPPAKRSLASSFSFASLPSLSSLLPRSFLQSMSEAVSQCGRVPGLGPVVYGALDFPPSSRVEGEEPPRKRRRVGGGGGGGGGEEREAWAARFVGAANGVGLGVLATAWDARSPRLAIALSGALLATDAAGRVQNTVVIYDAQSDEFVLALRTPQQKGIRCMQFSSLPGVLAVGCAAGVALWDIDSTCLEVAKVCGCVKKMEVSGFLKLS